jgi:CheY-like chemotaxis protein
MSDRSATILLIEDNEDDVFFMHRALKKAQITLPVQVAMDGQQALDYVSGAGKYSDRAEYPLPSLIFLDLKLPFLSGFDFLSWLRNQPALKELPVVILTSSFEDRDRQRAKELAAKTYLVKPPSPEMLLEAIQYLQQHQTAVA